MLRLSIYTCALSWLISVPSATALKYYANDWSSTIQEEAAGHAWQDADGTVLPLETIMADAGLNLAATRLWIEPTSNGYNTLDDNIKLGKRAQAAGLKNALGMHLSNTWADAGNQVFIPSGTSAGSTDKPPGHSTEMGRTRCQLAWGRV